jgi:hypothetical protein
LKLVGGAESDRAHLEVREGLPTHDSTGGRALGIRGVGEGGPRPGFIPAAWTRVGERRERVGLGGRREGSKSVGSGMRAGRGAAGAGFGAG